VNEPVDAATKHQIERMVEDLCAEFAGQFSRGQIEEIMADSADQVTASARVFDFVPLMAYRFTRERLNAIQRAKRQDMEGAWDVVFVRLSGGGRSRSPRH
jgi:hypothetical protein